MKYVYDDGGRASAGYRGNTSDCVCRAIAIAAGLPYQEVYDRLADGNATNRRTRGRRTAGRRSAAQGIYTKSKWFKEYMQKLGFVWVPTMKIGSGCKVHLVDGELPVGRLVVSVSKHYTAVVDGVIHDTHNPSDRAPTIFPPNTPMSEMPKGVRPLENGNGWSYEPDRCVYGYWIKEIAA